jgi:hypothetical protein
MVEDLEHPQRGAEKTFALLRRDLPFDVFLMAVAERTLVAVGAHDPEAMLRFLRELQRDGCAWFRPSALYVAFHLMRRAGTPSADALAAYGDLTRETVTSTRALLETDCGRYSLSPHIAWAELVLAPHGAPMLAGFLADAMRSGDAGYVRRVLGACDIMCLAYRAPGSAVASLRAALGDGVPAEVREPLVDTLTNLRFYQEEAVDRFIAETGDPDLGRAVLARAPTIRAVDFPTWIDDFMNHQMLASADFRMELVDIFRRVADARDVTDVLKMVLAWGTRLIAGERAPFRA